MYFWISCLFPDPELWNVNSSGVEITWIKEIIENRCAVYWQDKRVPVD